MIAVTFAHPSESRDFVRLLGDRHPEVIIFHTGIGGDVCRHSISSFLDRQPFEFLISSGFAGGADPSLGIGDLILAENFSNPALLAQARETVIARVARLATADRVIESEAERLRFAREQEAAAVDMETQWIARACSERSLPMLSLRAISDTAAAPFPAPAGVLFDLTRQRTNWRALAFHLIIHPAKVRRTARFARQIAEARERLAEALKLLVRGLG